MPAKYFFTVALFLATIPAINGCSPSSPVPGYRGQVTCIAVSGADIWIGTPSGLVRFPAAGKPEQFVWTGTLSGTVKCPAGHIPSDITHLADANSGINQVRAICEWKGGLALATAGGVVLFSTAEGRFGRAWKSRDGLGSENVRSIFTDGKRLWAATIFGPSVLDSSGKRWKNFDLSSGLPSRHTFCMAKYDGKIWVSCINGGLAWLDEKPGRWHAIPQERGLGNKYIYSVESTPGGLWLGTAGGVNLFTARGSWDDKICSDGFTEYSVYAIRAVEKTLWFGTAYGLFSRPLNPGKNDKTMLIKGLPSNDVSCILPYGKTLYVGTKSGLARIKLPK